MKLTIKAGVNYRNADNKVLKLTDVVIRAGEKAVAFATLAGKWTAEQALKEFKKAPQKFAPQGAMTAADVALYAKAA
jgi:hypothetical protein